MEKNMGSLDRKIRVFAALVFVVLILFGVVSGWLAALLGVLAGVFLVTSFISTCPLYIPFGIDTRKKSG
jgi:phosphotransferase system  glucose/maltose/N-acetylglucosamine-specific IIC component